MARKKKADKSKKYTLKTAPSSYLSLLYGVLTVIVIFVLIFIGSKIISQKSKGQISDNGATVARQEIKEHTYTVSQGDSLWKISEKYYGDGFKWVDIAKANNISNPDSIEIGQKIAVPVVAKSIKVENQTIETGRGITGNKYTVQKGDDLWNIAVRKYADGYKWTEIAKVNNLSNPSIIHSGNVLILPKS